jgi:hypothetical protein
VRFCLIEIFFLFFLTEEAAKSILCIIGELPGVNLIKLVLRRRRPPFAVRRSPSAVTDAPNK